MSNGLCSSVNEYLHKLLEKGGGPFLRQAVSHDSLISEVKGLDEVVLDHSFSMIWIVINGLTSLFSISE